MKRSSFLLAVWLVLGVVHFASAQGTTDDSELGLAKARIAELEQEVTVLKARITLLEEQLSAANPSKSAAVQPEQPQPSPSAATPAPRPKPAMKFQTMIQPIQQLPPQLRPRLNQKWDSIERNKAESWLKENIPGSQFEGRLKVHVGQAFKQGKMIVDGKSVDRYLLHLTFTHDDFDYLGYSFKNVHSNMRLEVDETLLRAYQKIDPKIPLRVTGTFKSFGFGFSVDQYSHVTWTFDDWKIHSPHLPKD